MNRAYLIFKHEFLQTIRRAGFLVMTLVVPVGALAGIGILSLATGRPDANVAATQEIGGVSEPGANPANLLVPGVFSLLLALALMFGSATLIRGVAEEKESRLIEVLFSSVSLRQLLIGKVLALGAA